jgi:hypothetical protein
MRRFLSLGTDCIEIKKLLINPKVSSLASIALMLHSCTDFMLFEYSKSSPYFSAALADALARVTSLESKLKTTSKTRKDADAAKTSADKATKAAEAGASKAGKALAEVAQKQANCEGVVEKRLDAIVASVGSKFFVLPLYPSTLLPIDMLLLAYLYFHDAVEQLGEVVKLSS